MHATSARADELAPPLEAEIWSIDDARAARDARDRHDDRRCPVPAAPEHIGVLGVLVASSTADEAVHRLRWRLRNGLRTRLYFANAHTLNLATGHPDVHAAIRRGDEVLNDGIGMEIAGRLQGHRFPANLHGSDFNLRILELAAEEGLGVFLLGGALGVADEAAAAVRTKVPGLRIVGTRHGFHGDPAADARAVREAGADVVLVALGQPRQELWIDRQLEASGARLGVGVGAFLDFQAGRVRRAPDWANRWGVEWLHRLALEPRRLWRRYVVGNPLFLWRVATYREAGMLQPRPALAPASTPRRRRDDTPLVGAPVAAPAPVTVLAVERSAAAEAVRA